MKIIGEVPGYGGTVGNRLMVKFANGTPNDTECKFRLIKTSTGTKQEKSIKAISNIYWYQDKTQDKSWLSGDALKKGVTVNYTLTAKPDESHKTGRWFASGLHFVDTMKIPDDIKAEYDLAAAIRKAGFEKFTIIEPEIPKDNGSEPTGENTNNTETIDESADDTETTDNNTKSPENTLTAKNEITFDFWVYSNDESKEMKPVSIVLPVTFRYNNTTYPNTDVIIENSLNVSVRGVGASGTTKDKDLGSTKVELSVSTPTAPAPYITVSKTCDKPRLSYERDMTSDTSGKKTTKEDLTYTITLTNDGDAGCDVTLTEKPNSEITITSFGENKDNTDNTNNKTIKVHVPAYSKVEIPVTAKLTVEDEGRFTNLVEYEYTYKLKEKNETTGQWTETDRTEKGSAYHTIEVKKDHPVIDVTKTGWVKSKIHGENYEYPTEYLPGDEIHYLITIENSGDADGHADVLDPLSKDVNWIKAIVTNPNVEEPAEKTTEEKIENNVYSHFFDKIEHDKPITIELIGTVNGDT
ncbi:MAG: hypothetical protein K2J39_13000, partial [Ruminococcus sp.]|nr:hypothetical protein [Ruminococcus sp.]